MQNLAVYLLSILMVQTAFALVPSDQELNITQVTMAQTLEQIVGIFSQEYAPLEWKIKSQNWDLKAEYDKAKERITNNPDITISEFHSLLLDFIHSTRDHHVGIQFYSTEYARLPFEIVSAEGRYFLVWIDRTKLPPENFPFPEGTEVIAFDGHPVHEVVRSLLPKSSTHPTLTERRIAEKMLTFRMRAFGNPIARGQMMLTLVKPDGQLATFPFFWEYQEELLTERVPVRNELFSKASLSANPQLQATGPQPSPFARGARISFVPQLGPIVAQGSDESAFNWYVFRLPNRYNIGYIRIGSFMAPDTVKSAQEFGQLISQLETITDALVLDVTSNPGGDMNYMYSLLSRLSDQPLETLKHRMMITTDFEIEAALNLSQASNIQNDEDAKKAIGPEADLFPFPYQLLQSIIEGSRFILSELKQGRRLTNFGYIAGIQSITPFSGQVYTKPLLVLVNELDFSGGDFFPAILQDNKRATIFGERTAGAGGAVKDTSFPNQFHIQSLQYTWTIAQRINGELLENSGVQPDREYHITADDLQSGFARYRNAVIETVTQLIASDEESKLRSH